MVATFLPWYTQTSGSQHPGIRGNRNYVRSRTSRTSVSANAKNARAEERAEDHNLLLAANAWMTEEFDEQDGETASSTQKQQSFAGNDDVDERQKGDEQNKENDVNGECENNELCSKHMTKRSTVKKSVAFSQRVVGGRC